MSTGKAESLAVQARYRSDPSSAEPENKGLIPFWLELSVGPISLHLGSDLGDSVIYFWGKHTQCTT